jgi:hypothetical protein
MNIRLQIERLVVDGLPLAPGQAAQLGAAAEAELARLLAEGGLAPGLLSGAAVPSVPGGALRLAGAAGPLQIGRAVARSVYAGLGAAGQAKERAG